VPYADAVAVRDRAAAVGIPHELRALAGAVHGAPGSTTAVRQWVAEFLDQHLT
jgi:acetyl esterase/lipase